MTNETKQLPKSAFQFLAPATVSTVADESLAKSERTLSGIAYSGDIITDHCYWNRLVIDLSSTTITPPIPLLCCHEQAETIGLVSDVSISNQISIQARLFADIDDDAAEIAAKADRGFPWQLSVGIYPQSFEEVAPGIGINLNGKQFTGPLTIFRGGVVREVSVVAVGADRGASATVLNAGNSINVSFITHEDELVELTKAQARIAELEAENAQLKTKNTELAASKPDASKFVPIEAVAGLQTELSGLREQAAEYAVNDLVKPALLDGRLNTAQEDWARELGKSNLSALKSYLETTKPIAALSGTQTGGIAPREVKLTALSIPGDTRVDTESLLLHDKAKQFQAHNPNVSYIDAVIAVS